MNLIATLYTLFIACKWISAITVLPNGGNANKSTHQQPETRLALDDKSSKNVDSTERMRRLIPYMTFYIPTSNREYLPARDEYNGYKQLLIQKPDSYKQSPPNTAANYGSSQLYLNGASAAVPRPLALKQPPPLPPLPPPPQLPSYFSSKNHHNTINNANRKFISNVTELHAIVLTAPQPQQPSLTSINQYAADFVAAIPNINNNVYNFHAQSNVIHAPQNNEHNNFITPFLPSNQLPGSFRPIIYQHDSKSSQSNENQPHRLAQTNTISKQQPTLSPPHVDITPTTEKPFFFQPQSPKQQKYATYLRPESPKFVQLVSTTTQPITNNIEDPVLYPVKQAPKPLITYTKPSKPIVYHSSYYPSSQQTFPLNSERAQNVKSSKYYANVNYELDPDDGYGGKVLISNNQFHGTKYQNNQPHRQYHQSFNQYNKYPVAHSTVPPPPPPPLPPLPPLPMLPQLPALRIQSAPVKQPLSYGEYEQQPIGGFQSSAEKPYRFSLTTQDTRQHLTETTKVQSSAGVGSYDHLNPSSIYDVNHHNQHNQQPNYDDDYQNELNSVANYSPEPVTHNSITENYAPPTSERPIAVPDALAHLNSTSLAQLLTDLQDANYVPKSFTMNNLGSSMNMLANALNDLKIKSQNGVKPMPFKPLPELPPATSSPKYYTHTDEYEHIGSSKPAQAYKGVPGPNSGRPGIDYPVLAGIPKTSFDCKEQRYKGFFGDPETECQVWHYCDLNGGQASFLCPNGTIFSQVLLTCDWWFNVKCSATAQLYVLNERLYKYILPFSPKFPEDYSGPLVDKYLAIKFQEMEEKMRREKNKNRANDADDNAAEDSDDEAKSEIEFDDAVQTDGPIANDDGSTQLVDADGQSHNIDNAIQLTSPTIEQNHDDNTEYSVDYGETTKQPNNQALPAIIIAASGESVTNDHRNVYQTTPHSPTSQPLPPLPKVQVESERLEVIEISSDGSSGHLTPGRDQH